MELRRKFLAAGMLAILCGTTWISQGEARSTRRWYYPQYPQPAYARVNPQTASASGFQNASYSGATSQQLTVLQVLNALNDLRRANGLAPVRLESRLNQAAQAHSNYMAANRIMSHTGINGTHAADRIEATGYNWRKVAENVAAGQRSAAEVVDAWAHSPGHRANMLAKDVTEVGIGVTNNYWTMDLARQ